MLEEILQIFGFTEGEIKELVKNYNKTSIEDYRFFVGMKYFVKKTDCLSDFVVSLEAISNGLGLAKQRDTLVVLQEIFRKYLQEEKILLLKKWAFSPPYRLGEKAGDYRHLMKIDQINDTDWHKTHDEKYFPRDEKCYTGENWYCQCTEWMKDNEDKVDYYLDQLVDKLYAMRCATYHEGFPVFIADRLEDHEEVTTYEVYGNGSGELVSFMTDMSLKDMKDIFHTIIYNLIKDTKQLTE